MAAARLPAFLIWRDGRPRFVPGARERALGFKGEDLRVDGVWLTFEQARAWGEANYTKIVAARQSGKRIRKPAAPKGRTVENLLGDFLVAIQRDRDRAIARGDLEAIRKSQAQKRGKRRSVLSQEAIDSYEKAARAVIYTPETRAAAKDRRALVAAAELLGVALPPRARELFAVTNLTAIGKPELRDFFNHVWDTRGHHMAIACIGVISSAWTWGTEDPAWRLSANPRLDMSFERPDGRVMLIPLDQLMAMVSAADAIGTPSIGDAIYLGLFTGQRQKDRLALVDAGLIEGRRHFVQSKTGAEVKIKEAPALAARLAQARARTAAIALRMGNRPEARATTIVVDEASGQPYNGSTYRHRFDQVRAHAATTLAAVADKRDQDLRDTCVILLHRCGVDALGICDITGHAYTSVETIIKHYLGRDAARADAAIDKLAAFVAAQGSGV